jgi:hypothetical protein
MSGARAKTVFRFHCQECGFGDDEVGHLTDATEVYCVVCLEQDDQLVRLRRWQEEKEEAQARVRTGFVDA